MASLIFGIETIGEKWESLDGYTQSELSRSVLKPSVSKAEEQVLLSDLKSSLSFSPLTGSIVAIGLYDCDRKQGAIYYSGEEKVGDVPYGNYILKERTEKEMLEDFWEGATSYDTFVSFNGRRFDVPFLIHRSVIHGIHPSCDLMERRYLYQQKNLRHIDLLDQLSFYGAMTRKGSLHLYCRAYGIKSPKTLSVNGGEIASLFTQKKFKTIAQYAADDITATAALYEKWLSYLAPSDIWDFTA
jgi:3'-5' exonuclease